MFATHLSPSAPAKTAANLPSGLSELPCLSHVEELVVAMQRAGIERLLLAPCSVDPRRCDRHYLCHDVALEDMIHHIASYPASFSGLAGYDPNNIVDSLRQVDAAIRDYNLKGVYVNTGVLRTSLLDRRLYPGFAKAAELNTTLMIRIHEDQGTGRLEQVSVLAGDFPTLRIAVACDCWPLIDEMRSLLYRWDNLFFVLDANVPSDQAEETSVFLNSEMGQERCLWGSNRDSWQDSLHKIDQWGLTGEARVRFLRENAVRVFDLACQFAPAVKHSAEVLTAE